MGSAMRVGRTVAADTSAPDAASTSPAMTDPICAAPGARPRLRRRTPITC